MFKDHFTAEWTKEGRMKAEFDENEHPRDASGRFTSGGGSAAEVSAGGSGDKVDIANYEAKLTSLKEEYNKKAKEHDEACKKFSSLADEYDKLQYDLMDKGAAGKDIEKVYKEKKAIERLAVIHKRLSDGHKSLADQII